MYLTCGHQRIGVKVEHDLRDNDGHPTYGLYRPNDQISLDSSTPRTERRSVLVHELTHAFEQIMGQINSSHSESRANRVAAIESQFAKDLAAQGGEGVLHTLFGDSESQLPFDDFGDTQYVQDEDAAEWPTKIWCPHCHEMYPSRAIRNGQVGFNPRLNAFMLKRVLVCGKCGRETLWGQRCTYDGLPLPDVVVSPTTRMLPAMA